MECLLVPSEVREDLLEQLLRDLDVHMDFKQADVNYIATLQA